MFVVGFVKTAADVVHMGEWLKKHPHYHTEKKIGRMYGSTVKKLKPVAHKIKEYAPFAGLAGLGALAYYGAKEDKKGRRK